MNRQYNFRFWTGPCTVEETAKRLGDAYRAGTEWVYGTSLAPDAEVVRTVVHSDIVRAGFSGFKLHDVQVWEVA